LAGLPFTLPLHGAARLRISNRSGRVLVVCEERTDILVERGVDSPAGVDSEAPGQYRMAGDHGGSSTIELRCPAGTDLVIGTLSGRVEVKGRAGAVVISTASGSIDVERALAVDLRSLSGDIAIGSCLGNCRLHTKSGKVHVAASGRAEVSTISGRVTLAHECDDTPCSDELKVRTASGGVEVDAMGPHNMSINTLSGSVTVRLPQEVHPSAKIRSLSGRPRIAVDPGTDCEVAVSTMSGRVELVTS
jgi:DUF4097 and DUF4098 domain-containing protein YvlB